jgi:hypothetical protein
MNFFKKFSSYETLIHNRKQTGLRCSLTQVRSIYIYIYIYSYIYIYIYMRGYCDGKKIDPEVLTHFHVFSAPEYEERK